MFRGPMKVTGSTRKSTDLLVEVHLDRLNWQFTPFYHSFYSNCSMNLTNIFLKKLRTGKKAKILKYIGEKLAGPSGHAV
jgi:hypothetical protein